MVFMRCDGRYKHGRLIAPKWFRCAEDARCAKHVFQANRIVCILIFGILSSIYKYPVHVCVHGVRSKACSRLWTPTPSNLICDMLSFYSFFAIHHEAARDPHLYVTIEQWPRSILFGRCSGGEVLPRGAKEEEEEETKGTIQQKYELKYGQDVRCHNIWAR